MLIKHKIPLKKILKITKITLVVCIFLLVVFSILPVMASDLISTNFIMRDPVIVIAGNQSSSLTFQYFSNAGQIAPGESTSSSFIYRAGSLYFPTANSPVISATAGNIKVDLSWTTSVGALANVTSYELGTSTTAGGPYTFEDIGNIFSYSKTGLTNGTTYYFKVKANAGTLTLAQSAEVSSVPTAPSSSSSSGGGGGGGGGGGAPPPAGGNAGVNFLGKAYPLSKVTVLKDGQIAITTIAGPDANFSVSLSGISAGGYVFSVYGEDSKGLRSSPFTFPVYLTSGATTNISGIFIAPTIDVDKSEVKKGDNIAIFGQSIPNSKITISVNSDQPFFNETNSDKNGIYLYNFDTTPLDMGNHSTKSKATLNNEISSFSQSVGFIVGTKTVIAKPTEKVIKSDLNNDKKVNLVDFSIAAFWYKKTLSETFKLVEMEKLNGDGKINLIDFSIIAYYWTG